MYFQIGKKKVEVVKNPTKNELSAMKREFKERKNHRGKSKKSGQGDHLLRFIEIGKDSYYWIAYDAVHPEIRDSLVSILEGKDND